MPYSTTRKKPAKPYRGFPLFPHVNGFWAKKIKGKLYYFGKWDDPDAALERSLKERDDWNAGRNPRTKRTDGLQLRGLLNEFLTAKRLVLDAGEIVARTFADYHEMCERGPRTRPTTHCPPKPPSC